MDRKRRLMENNNGWPLRSQLFDGAPFRLPLLSTAVPASAASGTTATFTRATTKTWQNNDGYLVTGVAGEIGFVGARRVYNQMTNTGWTGGTSGTLGSGGVAPTGWTALGGTGSITFSDSAAHSGSKSIRFQATAQRPYIQQSIAVLASSVYMMLVTVEAATTANLLSNLLAIATVPAGATSVYLKNGAVVDGPTTTASAGDVIGMRLTVSTTTGTPDWRIGLGAAGSPTGDVTLAGPRLVNITAETDQTTAREYVSVGVESAPYYHGSFVDGVKCFPTDLAGNPLTTMLGYLAEGARTNLCLQSNAFTTTWAQIGTPTPVQNVVGPDGAVSAWTFTDDNAAASEEIYQSLVLIAGAHTLSVFVGKTVGVQSSYPCFLFSPVVGAANFSAVTIDTTNGIATAWTAYTGKTMASGISASCVSYNDDFWRVSLTATATAEAWYAELFPAATSNATQSTGTLDAAVTGSAVFYGAQLELGSFASSYIATTTAAVTRNADVLTYSSAGNILGTAGAAYAEVFRSAPIDSSGHSILCNATVNRSLMVMRSTTALLGYYDGTNDISSNAPAITSGATNKVAISYFGSASQTAVRGTVSSSSAFDGNFNVDASIEIGNNGSGTGAEFYGNIRNVRIWQRALSSSELGAITS